MRRPKNTTNSCTGKGVPRMIEMQNRAIPSSTRIAEQCAQHEDADREHSQPHAPSAGHGCQPRRARTYGATTAPRTSAS